ncbi:MULTISPECIES: hypothetical protein [unclassified Sphingobium]|uniref:hypothetical protein n=1 Tax=unclassified Sphingobium TaxID=2611147 RepID=UPI00222586EF|nr:MULTISPECIES: hypothetical protein [unclassified Sphingobium]MCW2412920.1 hypothetical protein [Sphingobium sp. B8D3D]MCW2414782.1 hypothetical protein [Sphingobium sp. B8D3A]
MTKFNPSMIVPVSKSVEFSGEEQGRTAKHILLEGIDNQIALYKEPTKNGRRWFTIGKEEVSLTLRVNNKALPLLGTETKVAVPLAHFEDAMLHFKAQVEAGEMDAALATADEGIATRRSKMRETRKAKATATA